MKIFKNKLYFIICIMGVICLSIVSFRCYYRHLMGLNPPIDYHFDTSIDISDTEICGSNLVIDGGFENTKFKRHKDTSFLMGEWSFSSGWDHGYIKIIENNGYNNTRCVMLSFPTEYSNGSLMQKLSFDQLPEAILVEVLIKTVDLEGEGAGFSIDFSNYEFLYGGPKYPEGQLAICRSDFLSGTNSWSKLSKAIRVPPVTEEITIFGRASGKSGKAFFDDIKVFPLKIKHTSNIPVK